MSSIKLIILSMYMGLFLVACAGPRYYVDPAWKGQPQPKTVKVIYTEPQIGNPDDLKDDLPEYEANFASGWFEPQLKTFLYERANKSVDFSMNMVSADQITTETVKLGKEDFNAPSYASIEGDAEIYIVLSNVWVGRENEEYQTVQGNAASEAMATPGSGMSLYKFFKCKANYAFYEAKTKKILAYGTAEGKAQYQFAVDKGNWEFSLRDLAYHILIDTPVYHW